MLDYKGSLIMPFFDSTSFWLNTTFAERSVYGKLVYKYRNVVVILMLRNN